MSICCRLRFTNPHQSVNFKSYRQQILWGEHQALRKMLHFYFFPLWDFSLLLHCAAKHCSRNPKAFQVYQTDIMSVIVVKICIKCCKRHWEYFHLMKCAATKKQTIFSLTVSFSAKIIKLQKVETSWYRISRTVRQILQESYMKQNLMLSYSLVCRLRLLLQSGTNVCDFKKSRCSQIQHTTEWIAFRDRILTFT